MFWMRGSPWAEVIWRWPATNERKDAMCTVVLLRRPGHRWPLLMATNRDEIRGRPWLPPGRHWPEQPDVVAGLDRLGGGSWLGANDRGLVVTVTNRTGTLGPASGKQSRGELILKALEHADAATAVQKLSGLNPGAYRAFNMIVADAAGVFWLHHREGEGIGYSNVPEGISMLTDRDINDSRSERIRRYLPGFAGLPEPDPEAEDGWASWKPLLGDRQFDRADGPRSAMTLSDGEFATLSSSLIALPAIGNPQKHELLWYFAAGPSDCEPYRKVEV